MVFLPRTSFQQQEACRTIVESEVLGFGYAIRGWRQVPVDTSVLGEKAAATRPEIEQIIIGNPKGVDEEQFERDLYLIRRRIEKQALAENITDFYICSLSCRSVIYKGLFLAESLAAFYPDLQDERFVSSFALFHQRYSTNTMPSWKLAQPFRTLAHNGEINTLRGNVNWMKSHETRMVAPAFGEHNEDVKPIIQPGSSDSAALDAVCEALVRAGRPLPLVKTMLIPPAWSQPHGDPARRTATCSATATASWSPGTARPRSSPPTRAGWWPAWTAAACGPMRYSRTRDGLLVVGSETGMVPLVDTDVSRRAGSARARTSRVDLATGRFYHDLELKDHLAGAQALQPLDGEHHPSRRAHAGAALRARRLRARRAAPPPGALRAHHRGHGADPRAHGARRQGGGGLDGRRHAAGRALHGTIAACTTSSASSSARSPTRRSTRCANGG